MKLPKKYRKIQRKESPLIKETKKKVHESTETRKTKRRSNAKRKYSNQKLIRKLKAEAKKLGKTPTVSHFTETPDLPSPIVYTQRWGSWNNAVRAAGLKPNKRSPQRKSRENMLSKEAKRERKIDIKEIKAIHSQTDDLSFHRRIPRGLSRGISKINRLATRLNLSEDVRSKSKDLLIEHREKNGLKGRNIETSAAAAIYIECRKRDIVIQLEKIAELANVSKKDVFGAYKNMAKKLGISVKPFSPVQFLSVISEKLSISEEGRKNARKLIEKSKREIQGRKPEVAAASALYLSEPNLTQNEVAEAAGVTEVSIRNTNKVLDSGTL